MRHWMMFKFKGTALNRLRSGYFHRRNYPALEALLRQIGQHCFDERNDGVFAPEILRTFCLSSHFRTRSHAHLPALIACGAIEKDGTNTYRYVGFHEHNLPAKDIKEREAKDQAYWSKAKRSTRALHSAAMEYAYSMHTQQEENPCFGGNKALSEKCPAQTTEPTPPEADLSASNHSIRTQAVPVVGTAREKQSESPKKLPPSLAAVVEQARAAAEKHQQSTLSDDEIAAVERELTGRTSPAPTRPPPSQPKFPPRVARKPKSVSPITEETMHKALHGLKASLSRQATEAWWMDMTAMGACAEDLEHAVFSVKHQREKNNLKIYNAVSYARKIVQVQVMELKALGLRGQNQLRA